LDIFLTLSTVASVFLLLLAGYGAKRIGILKATDARVVNSIVVNLTMPAFIFTSIHSRSLYPAMMKVPILGLVLQTAVLGLAYASARALKLDRRTTGGLMLAAAFGNTGFLGYPMVAAAFSNDPRAMPTAVMFDELAMSIMLNSVGVAIASSFGGKSFEWGSLLDFLRNPLFPSTLLSLALRTAYVPPTIMKTMEFLAAGTVPLAMISIGLSLSARSMKKYPAAFGTSCALKMLVMPVAMYFLSPLVGVTGTIRQVAVVECAVPTAVIAGVIAGRYDANEEFVAGAIFVSTLLGIAVIPATLMLVG